MSLPVQALLDVPAPAQGSETRALPFFPFSSSSWAARPPGPKVGCRQQHRTQPRPLRVDVVAQKTMEVRGLGHFLKVGEEARVQRQKVVEAGLQLGLTPGLRPSFGPPALPPRVAALLKVVPLPFLVASSPAAVPQGGNRDARFQIPKEVPCLRSLAIAHAPA